MPATSAKKSTAMRVVMTVLSVLGVAVVGLVSVYIFGSVYGTEICPETLERRYFYYREIPLVHWQVQSTWHLDQTGALEKHLSSSNLLKPAPTKKTWHIVSIGRGLSGLRHDDPEILVRYLDARDANQEIAWLKWTEKEPKLASDVWQGVCDLAVAGEYTTIPDLLELAHSATDPVKTQAEIKRIVQAATKAAPPPASGSTPLQAEKE